jgi:hypothetical protein
MQSSQICLLDEKASAKILNQKRSPFVNGEFKGKVQNSSN